MCILSIGCVKIESNRTNNSNTYQNGEYRTFTSMINQCKGTTIVVAIGELEANWDHAKINIIVIDSTTTTYGCLIGDTIK